jgi:hypothetical protein
MAFITGWRARTGFTGPFGATSVLSFVGVSTTDHHVGHLSGHRHQIIRHYPLRSASIVVDFSNRAPPNRIDAARICSSTSCGLITPAILVTSMLQ